MDENKQEVKNKVEDKEPAPSDSREGDKPKTPQTIIDALNAAERLEKATAKHKAQLDRQEDMISRKILGGEGGGRADTPEISEEQKKVNAASEYFKGTQLERDIRKANE